MAVAQAEKPEKQGRVRPSDFSDEYRGKTATITLGAGNPPVIRGRIEAASRYWVKVVVGQRTLYINKAWIVSIEPAG